MKRSGPGTGLQMRLSSRDRGQIRRSVLKHGTERNRGGTFRSVPPTKMRNTGILRSNSPRNLSFLRQETDTHLHQLPQAKARGRGSFSMRMCNLQVCKSALANIIAKWPEVPLNTKTRYLWLESYTSNFWRIETSGQTLDSMHAR